MISKNELEEILPLINTRAAYKAFLDALESPDWIPALVEAGLFSKPAEPDIQATDFFGKPSTSIGFPEWPPSRYLARMGSTKDPVVLDAIKAIPQNDNIYIHSDLIDVLLNYSLSETRTIVENELDWIQSQSQLYLYYPDKIVKLIEHVLPEDPSLAIELTGAVFAVNMKEDEFGGRPTRREDLLKFDGWEYNELLKRLSLSFVQAQSLDFANWVISQLELILTSIAPETKIIAGVRDDFSWIWRQTIEESEEHHIDWNGRNALITSLRETGLGFTSLTGNAALGLINLLKESEWIIFKRFGLFFVSTNPERFPVETREYLLSKENFDAPALRHEYLMLMREGYHLLGDEERMVIWEYIDETKDSIKYQWYNSLKDFLSPQRQEQFLALQTEYSQENVFEFPFVFSTHMGTVSPISADDLLQKSDDDLIAYLRTWQSADQLREPNVEGLSDVLGTAATIDPGRIGNLLLQIDAINEPTFLSSALRGLVEALRGAATFDINSILRACLTIEFGDRQTRSQTPQSGEDLDRNWTWSASCALDFVRTSIDGDKLNHEALPLALDVIAKLINHPNPTVEEETSRLAYEDPLTIAINSTKGKATDALLALARWCATKNLLEQYRETFENIFSLNISEDQKSLAVRAVYGMNLIPLLSIFPDWTKASLRLIFPDNIVEFLAAWQAYIVYSNPQVQFLGALKIYYERNIEIYREGLNPNLGRMIEDPGMRLADHFASICINSEWELTEPLLSTFFNSVDSKYKAEFWRYIGRNLSTFGEKWPRSLLARMARFWTSRRETNEMTREEALTFGWWVICRSFDTGWALQELEYALTRSDASGIERSDQCIEFIANASATHPESSLSALIAYLKTLTNGYEAAYLSGHIKIILKNSLPKFADEVDTAVDLLVGLGLLEFKSYSSAAN